MFDIEELQREWESLYKPLTEEEIFNIYDSEGATWESWNKKYKEYISKINILTTEERLLANLFSSINNKELQDKVNEENRLREEIPFPEINSLSEEKQKEVIVGSMNIVFEMSKYYHKVYLEGKADLETIYFICLESLITGVKNCKLKKNYFNAYIKTCMLKSIEGYMSKNTDGRLKFIPTKPSEIYYMTRNISYNEPYIENLSSDEFIVDYNDVLKELPYYEKEVMKLSYDNNGNPGLTYNEMSDYLAITPNEVRNAKKRALNKLRKSNILKDRM